MNKILILMALLVTLTITIGCEVPIDTKRKIKDFKEKEKEKKLVEPSLTTYEGRNPHVQRITSTVKHDGHDVIIWEHIQYRYSRGGIMHHPDCKLCAEKEGKE